MFFKDSFGGALEMASASVLKLGDLMKNNDFKSALIAFLKSYRDWIDQDFSSAFWTDAIAVTVICKIWRLWEQALRNFTLTVPPDKAFMAL